MVKTTLLIENEITKKIYTYDDEFVELFNSIKNKGILEPLIVHPIENNKYEVISGTRRLRVSRKLDLKTVPVLIQKYKKITEDLIVDHQQQRIKKHSDIIKEIVILKNKYGLKQGVRTDINSKVKKGKQKKQELVDKYNKTKVDRLTRINKLLDILEKTEPGIRKKELKNLDRQDNISGTLKKLSKKYKVLKNKKQIGKKYEVLQEDIKIFNKSSESLSEIEDNSVSTIITSPPYFNMRDYNTGKNQLGQEKTINRFINRLVNHFDDSKRVLKDNGTLWVNLSDNIKGYEYTSIPERFLMKMIDKGWMIHDKLIWKKNNPIYTSSNRSVQSHEFIYVFKKNNIPYYNPNWVNKYDEGIDCISYGKSKLKSIFEFKEGFITTNVSNNSTLKKECKRNNFELTHSATFPLSIPVIAILTSSKQGDLVLDLFNGSGTTGRASKLLGRKYVGYELNPSYIKESEIRINMSLESDILKVA